MGRVLRVFDAERQIDMAVKMLLREDPKWASRMMREAAAQSRLDHPNICPVYDYGERDGQHFICMRFIDGPRLDEACRGLSLEGKIRVLVDVVDAVHAAHIEGLIHRDLKPGNILVETEPDGALRPYVLDFGLVRQSGDETLTATGELLGTPGYMSPEQARGDDGLDRRSDIFSLGVILYELLTHQLPFKGTTPTQLLLDIASGEVLPIEKARVDVPGPLARIVHQCLEQSAALRYQDAASLKADLLAFLRGDSVAARHVGLLHRLNRKARRYPLFTSALLLAIVITAGAIALGIRSELSAQERAQSAAYYGRLTQTLESDLRLAWMKPPHDLTAELQSARKRADELAESIPELPSLARDLARLAAGKAYLLVDLPDKAIPMLLPLAESDAEHTEAAELLGRAYGRLYNQALDDALQSRSPEIRENRLAVIRRQYLEPARRHLESAGSDPGTRGLIAYFSGNFEAAVELLESQFEAEPWPVDTMLALVDTYLAAAATDATAADFDAAVGWLNRAGKHLRSAAEIARSHPMVQGAFCRLLNMNLFVERDFSEAAATPDADDYVMQCERGVLLQPQSSQASGRLARVLANLGSRTQRNGGDPRPTLRRSEVLARQILKQEPANHDARIVLAQSLSIHGAFVSGAGENPLPIWQEGIDAARVVVDARPADTDAWMTLAGLASRVASQMVAQEADFMEAEAMYAEAANAFRIAGKLPGAPSGADSSLGFVLADHAYYRYMRGLEADVLLQEALELTRDSVKVRPDYSSGHARLGYTAWTFAEYRYFKGEDASDLVTIADRAYRRARELSPGRTSFIINQQGPLTIAAIQRLDKGQEAIELISRLESLQAELLERTEGEVRMLVNDASNAVLRGRQVSLDGGVPATHFDRARELLRESAAFEIDQVSNLLVFARLALADLSSREVIDWQQVESDLDTLEEGLSRFPELAIVRASRGRLALQAASRSTSPDRTDRLSKMGRQELEQVVSTNALLARRFGKELSQLDSPVAADP